MTFIDLLIFQCQCTFQYSGLKCESKKRIEKASFNGMSFLTHSLGTISLENEILEIQISFATLVNNGDIVNIRVTYVFNTIYKSILFLCSNLEVNWSTSMKGVRVNDNKLTRFRIRNANSLWRF